MFKIAKDRRIDWPVLIAVPQTGGTVQKHKITVMFVILAQSRLDEIVQEAGGGDQDKAVLGAVIAGWDGVAGDDGQPVDFSAEALAALLDIPYARTALLRAYFEAASGAAARKN